MSRSNYRYRPITFLAAVVSVLTAAALISKSGVEAQEQQFGAFPKGVPFAVVPASDSPVQFLEVTMLVTDDEKVQLSVTSKDADKGAIGRESIHVVVDARQRIYRAVEMTPSAAVNELRIRQILDKHGRQDLGHEDSIRDVATRKALWLSQPLISASELILPPCNECEEDPCAGYADAFLETFDPVEIKVNETQSLVSWDREDTGAECTWDVNVWPACIAVSPTWAGTNWFTSSCGGWVLDDSEYNAWTKVSGNYWNDDFPLASLRTWVDTEIFTQMNEGNPVPSISYNWVPYGEWWWLLHAHWDTEWANGC